jgi:dTDP-glucose 4,6-dehydratase
MPLVLRNAMAGMKLPVYGDGGQLRDWLYVEDNCRALMMVLEKAEPGAIYNIGTGEERTNLSVVCEICNALAKQLGGDGSNFAKNIESVADRPGHDRRYILNTAKIGHEIGWTPSTSFADGLEKTVRWYADHPQWIIGVTSGDYLNYYESVYSRKWQDRST